MIYSLTQKQGAEFCVSLSVPVCYAIFDILCLSLPLTPQKQVTEWRSRAKLPSSCGGLGNCMKNLNHNASTLSLCHHKKRPWKLGGETYYDILSNTKRGAEFCM